MWDNHLFSWFEYDTIFKVECKKMWGEQLPDFLSQRYPALHDFSIYILIGISSF